jgi:hypothetical protein
MVVRRLQIESLVDDSLDPYGQAGCSSIVAYVFNDELVQCERGPSRRSICEQCRWREASAHAGASH